MIINAYVHIQSCSGMFSYLGYSRIIWIGVNVSEGCHFRIYFLFYLFLIIGLSAGFFFLTSLIKANTDSLTEYSNNDNRPEIEEFSLF